MSELPKIMQHVYIRLNTPDKIQTFINTLPANFELQGETYMSPLRTLKEQKAHCMEGALLAASILKYHGHKPLIMDLRAQKPDQDHVVTLFKNNGYWGAISKTNHAVLRYREPIYKTLRELALSYFHEYFDNATGSKNLREYSAAFNLEKFNRIQWETTDVDLWDIVDALDNSKHYFLLNKKQVKILRKAEPIEIKAGELTEWSKSGKKLF